MEGRKEGREGGRKGGREEEWLVNTVVIYMMFLDEGREYISYAY